MMTPESMFSKRPATRTILDVFFLIGLRMNFNHDFMKTGYNLCNELLALDFIQTLYKALFIFFQLLVKTLQPAETDLNKKVAKLEARIQLNNKQHELQIKANHDKISQLLEYITELQTENTKLKNENSNLKQKPSVQHNSSQTSTTGLETKIQAEINKLHQPCSEKMKQLHQQQNEKLKIAHNSIDRLCDTMLATHKDNSNLHRQQNQLRNTILALKQEIHEKDLEWRKINSKLSKMSLQCKKQEWTIHHLQDNNCWLKTNIEQYQQYAQYYDYCYENECGYAECYGNNQYMNTNACNSKYQCHQNDNGQQNNAQPQIPNSDTQSKPFVPETIAGHLSQSPGDAASPITTGPWSNRATSKPMPTRVNELRHPALFNRKYSEKPKIRKLPEGAYVHPPSPLTLIY